MTDYFILRSLNFTQSIITIWWTQKQ